MTEAQHPTLNPVRRARRKAGLSLREVAALTGIDPGNLSRIERNIRPLTYRNAKRLESVLPTKPYELVDLVPLDVGGGDGIFLHALAWAA